MNTGDNKDKASHTVKGHKQNVTHIVKQVALSTMPPIQWHKPIGGVKDTVSHCHHSKIQVVIRGLKMFKYIFFIILYFILVFINAQLLKLCFLKKSCAFNTHIYNKYNEWVSLI